MQALGEGYLGLMSGLGGATHVRVRTWSPHHLPQQEAPAELSDAPRAGMQPPS